ncbi:MAG: protein translocase subunit SecD [Solirubrobacteraceae bacterium]
MTERRRNLFVLLLVLGLLAGSVAVLVARETKLGLDLQGGVSLVYEATPAKQGQTITPESLDQSIEIIRERVDSLGVAEPSINQSGSDQIQIDLPAVENAENAADRVGSTAQMYFYDWELNLLDEDCLTNPDTPSSSSDATSPISGLRNAVLAAAKCDPYESDGTTRSSDARYYGFAKTGQPLNGGLPETDEEDLWAQEPGGEKPEGAEAIRVPDGILIVREEPPPAIGDAEPIEPDLWWLVQDEPALNGEDIENPEQSFDQTTNEPIVTMDFSDKGQRDFQAVTLELAQRGSDNALLGGSSIDQSMHFAIVLDNELVSVPYIDYAENPEGIDGETGAQISGSFTTQSAQELANFLKIGALPVRLELISRSQVSASLGQQALDQGLKAGIAGFAIVALFLLVFYRVLGLVAVTALAIYALYFYALVKLVPIVLTLPGIAGLILTLGVAADANIVIFERVKEEIRRGRSTGAAIAEGYKKGIGTILDANVVTFLVAFILFILATAGVKGFALVLGLGTVVSLFTAVLATQAILLSLRGTNLLKSKSSLGAGGERGGTRIDFMGKSKYFFSASGVILLIGAIGIAGKGLELGIDFEAGTRIQASLEQPVAVEQVRDTISEAGFEGSEVQTLTAEDLGDNVVQISTAQLEPPQVDEVENALDEAYGLESSSSNSIGPTFGQSIANSALVAIIASLVVIAVYIALRFQWKFAVPVLIALMHDILITAGVYALVGQEVTASTVAALLTILGFSLYDTIIVFDRIRENIPRMPSATFSQIVNRSMSEVIVRSLATSFCTALPVFGLLLFGGETLKDFAFALLIGTLSGTYSSVFIAGPVVSLWKEREPIYKARTARILAEHGHIPAYAVASAGEPIDIAPSKRGRRSVASSPEEGVSQEEFDDLVANLGVESKPTVAPPRTSRPAGGRRARAQDGENGEDKDRKPRNTRHGRPR